MIKNLNKLLKQFLNYTVDEGYVLKNPISGKKIVIPSEKEIKDEKIEIFTNDEIDSLKKALATHRLKGLILMALGTGLRQGELLALTWDDIDMNNLEVRVRKSLKRVSIINSDGSRKTEVLIQSPKSKSSNRTVPIPSSLIPVLEEHIKKQKIEKFKAGVPLKTVQTLLGHSNISITANIYTHVIPKEKVIAAEKLNHLFG